ncbi:PREDICTED: uncharacterized protein LOC108374595 [Rhagoletis zephyria]|uniref:uncharacterized protein LOC108374595 n=1 Tax=Rhagoletis zephyria TaxID=28612 RepID=UPI000811A5B7|nr:PREDICTED: uncharacterized protein LOC108374595 [Rhagoletis zephyria]
MSYYFEIITIYSIFIYSIYLQVGGTQQLSIHNRKHKETKRSVSDPTKGLTDTEIDMALDDLSLSDLSILSKLIDRPNAPDYDYANYDSRNYALGPPRDHTFDDDPIDYGINKNYYDDIDGLPGDARNFMYFKIPRQSLVPIMERRKNQRNKRENDGRTIQQAAMDAEYIRELENSFPRDQVQNNNEESEDKREHIRVKRN